MSTVAGESGAIVAEQAAPPRSGRGPWALMLRALLRRRLALLALIYISVFYVVGIFAPLLAPYDYRSQNLDLALQGPSLKHPLGTDRLGRDLLSRVIYAARTTVLITVLSSITGGLFIGPILGMLAGYRRGWLDSLINRFGEVVTSLPELMILITFTATFGPRLGDWVANFYDAPLIGTPLKEGFASILVLSIILTMLGWVGSMRTIRAQTLQLRETEYALAARAIGAGTWRIITRHILPNLSFLLVLSVAASFGSVALAEIGLSFLGLGVRPPTPSFGEMILAGAPTRTIERSPHLFFMPASFAVLLMLSFNLLGDALNDVLNPRTRDR